ncbi:MAG TPA: asparagine synthase (glutamine-hydrolyzing) [Blastocatellia bacterium]
MCGITGFTQKNWCPDPGRIQAATETLIHRGPDQQGVFRSPLACIGATRLKIIDLESGDQPIVASDGDLAIAFNGEIYNHLEVRAELERYGHRFESHTDTETVLRAFIQWDTDCFARLRGMFAVALWTTSQRRLVLARDRMGIKPLYVARRGNDLFFGSELKSILIHPEVDRYLSREGLDCYLSLNYVPSPWTLVEGVEKLSPGHWLEWRDGDVRSEPYWQLQASAPRERSLKSACEELDWLLSQSVKEHLLSDVPLGIWLSGGIDSSTVLHYAAQASGTRLKTFSISFHGRSFDETTYIHRAASVYGTDHEELDLNPTVDLQSAIEQFATYADDPVADAGALPVWFLSKLSKTKVTVTLSGEGSDELFGGYLTYRANQLANRARLAPRTALRLALRALKAWPVSDEKISFEYKLKRFLEGSLLPAEQSHVYWNGTFSRSDKEELLGSDFTSDALDLTLGGLRAAGRLDRLAPYLWFDQKYYLPDDILAKVDRMSMAHAVEVRPPFLDHRIVEFAAGLPDHFKVRGARQKVILKELMKNRLPSSIISRKKVGFDIPAHEWLRGPLRSMLTDTLAEGASTYPDLFRTEVIERHLNRHLTRQANIGYHLWGLMILFLWMKEWQIQTEPSPAWAAVSRGVGAYI